MNAASVEVASLDERKNAVYPRSIALVHRARHAQGDGGEERERSRRTVDAWRTRGERGCGGVGSCGRWRMTSTAFG